MLGLRLRDHEFLRSCGRLHVVVFFQVFPETFVGDQRPGDVPRLDVRAHQHLAGRLVRRIDLKEGPRDGLGVHGRARSNQQLRFKSPDQALAHALTLDFQPVGD
jgi:hypothetical protein